MIKFEVEIRLFALFIEIKMPHFHLSSPRAESARAVTGRQCPHSEEGEDFFSPQKDVRFSVIPARTGSVVLLGHFLMARTVPPSFVEIGPKLRVGTPLTWEWPKTGVSPKK